MIVDVRSEGPEVSSKGMTLTILQSNVNALIDMKLEKHKNLREESAFYWREIVDGTLKFDRRDSEVSAALLCASLPQLLFSYSQASLIRTSLYWRWTNWSKKFSGCSFEGPQKGRTVGILRQLHQSRFTSKKNP